MCVLTNTYISTCVWIVSVSYINNTVISLRFHDFRSSKSFGCLALIFHALFSSLTHLLTQLLTLFLFLYLILFILLFLLLYLFLVLYLYVQIFFPHYTFYLKLSNVRSLPRIVFRFLVNSARLYCMSVAKYIK